MKDKTMNNQKGFYNLNLMPLIVFSVIGLIATIVGVPWVLYWLFTNVSITLL